MAETTENPRKKIREARLARLRVIDGPPKTIKVYAGSETMRAMLRHSSGMRFRDSLDEAVEWPNDSFTARRIADGSVRTDGPGTSESATPDETQNPREQAAGSKAKSEPKAKSENHKAAPKSPPPQASA